MSKLWLPKEAPLSKLPPEDWDRYRGNNHHALPVMDHRTGGGIHFGSHVGKPLDKHLWHVLLLCIGAHGLCIYQNQEEWTIGWMGRHVIIRLDDAGNVRDIDLACGFF